MEIDSHRPSKKPRLLPTPSLTPPPLGTSSTSLFSPFRLIGLVTNEGVPFALSSDGNKLVTSAGQSYLEWNVRDLRLLGVVNVGREIKHLECNSEGRGSVWASGKGGVDMFVRGERVKRFELDEEGELLAKFIIFGSTMVALEDEGRRMYIWDMDSDEAARVIDFGPSFRASDIVHPSTYLNKVAVSSSSGTLAIWNVQTLMLLHTFIPSDLLPAPSAICAISQSPAVDLLALGFANGQVTIQDVRLGETLLTLPLSDEGSISSIAFRDGEHSQILATASFNGTITIYSLEGRPRILHTLREAHTGPIARIHFVPGQPVLLSSGSDNSLKEWNLDTPDVPRLLKQRSGHSAPPHLIRFYGEDGRILLSAGGDGQLRYISLVRDTRSSELSQGSIEKSAKKLHISLDTLRLPAVTSIAFSPTRAKEWDDILTSHLGRQQAQSWTIDSRRKGLHVLPKKVLNGLPARCVNVTACGNFGLVGGDGEVGMWNMQSGIKRRTFSLPAGTTAVVVGVETDGLNKNVIAATTNGTIAWFDFHSASVVGTISVGAGISKTSLKRENGLLLIVCDDFKVRLIDIETRKVVREFGGFHGRILDAAFSHDSRWLITASMDSVIRTFDIPTGHLVDAFRTPSVPTSIAFSPTGDFLASTHVGNVGIALWTNRAQFVQVSLKSFGEKEMREMAMPEFKGGDKDEGEDVVDESLSVPSTIPESNGAVKWSPLTNSNGTNMVTTSLMPRSKWIALLQLDVIRHRNKPKQPPKAPEQAPFFLPTVEGVEHKFDFSDVKDDSGKGKEKAFESRHLINFMDGIETELVRRIKAEPEDGDYADVFEYLRNLSPAGIDREIGGLTNICHLTLFLRAVLRRLELHLDFEMLQSFLNVTLRSHGDVVMPTGSEVHDDDEIEVDEELEREELLRLLRRIGEVEREESHRLGTLLGFALGSLKFVKNEPLG